MIHLALTIVAFLFLVFVGIMGLAILLIVLGQIGAAWDRWCRLKPSQPRPRRKYPTKEEYEKQMEEINRAKRQNRGENEEPRRREYPTKGEHEPRRSKYASQAEYFKYMEEVNRIYRANRGPGCLHGINWCNGIGTLGCCMRCARNEAPQNRGEDPNGKTS